MFGIGDKKDAPAEVGVLVYSVFDQVAGRYMSPICQPNDAVAARSVRDAISKPGPFADHPGDYSLFCLGAFDEASGRLIPNNSPRHVVHFATLLRPQENANPS